MITFIGGLWRRVIRSAGRTCMVIIISHFSFLIPHSSAAQTMTLVELNCENLFDYRHDDGKDDTGRNSATSPKNCFPPATTASPT